MIDEAVGTYHAAVVALVGAQPVEVMWPRPESPAGPAIWLDYVGVTWRQAAYRVAVRATCLAADGLGPNDQLRQLWALADLCIAAARTIGAGESVTSAPGTVAQSSGDWKTVEVTAGVPIAQCTAPDAIPFLPEEET